MKFLNEPEVKLIDTMGSDLTVVNAARVSFDKESHWADTQFSGGEFWLEERDEKLINYLAKHNHWTPFGHIFAQFRIKAPVFVARQLVKHQVGLVWNEVSRRYVDDEPEFFVPTWSKRPDASIKQGAGEKMPVDKQTFCDDQLMFATRMAYESYKTLLDNGVAPEQARMVLPLNHATEWYWSGSVAAFARVCKLRLDPHAQKETRSVAVKIDEALKEIFPVSWKALMDN